MSNQVAAVTGAASGIGLAIVKRFVNRRLNVVGIDIQEVIDGFEDPRFHLLIGSSDQTSVWERARQEADARFDAHPGVVVFCAGVARFGSILDLSDEDWELSYNVNVNSIRQGLRVLLPAMIEHGGGSIVTITSLDAFITEQNAAAYCSTKGAAAQLTRTVAIDFARQGIRANTIAPGTTDTPMFRRAVAGAPNPDELMVQRQQRNPLGRLLDPDEIAAAVEFAALDAHGLTAAVIPVDAGLSATFDYVPGGLSHI